MVRSPITVGPPVEGAWRTVALSVLAGIVSAFQAGKAPVALDLLRSDLQLTLTAASGLLSAFAIVGALAGVATGVLVDRVGARRLVLAGLALQALASALGAAAAGAVTLLATRVVEGVGFLAVAVAAPALIEAATAPAQRTRAFAAWSTFMPLGMATVMLGAPWLHAVGWRAYWLLNAAVLIAVAAALLVGTARPIAAVRAQGLARADLHALLRARAPRRLALLFTLFSAAFFAVVTFLPMVLAERWGLPGPTAGVLTALAVALGAAGNLAAGALLARGVPPRRLLAAAFAGLAPCALVVFLPAMPAPGAYVACLAFSAVGGLVPTVLFSLAPAAAPRPALVGATLGGLMQGNNLGLVIGPLAAGSLASTWGWPVVSWCVGGLCAVAAGLAAGRGRSHGT
ncbi:MFS transporter [Caldimonas sp. KR1-144]|uniref:MFS transporter n=1 Tax=Caldimonas sp. KR1-144 TaxID=3400911 RepID=UPI003BFF8ED6